MNYQKRLGELVSSNPDDTATNESVATAIDLIGQLVYKISFPVAPFFTIAFDGGVDICWENDGKSLILQVPHDGKAPYSYMRLSGGDSQFTDGELDTDVIEAGLNWVVDGEW